MKNPFSYLFRARDKPQNAVSAAPSFYFGMSGSGKSVSPSSAIQVSAVYACVRVIAETIASLPFHLLLKGRRMAHLKYLDWVNLEHGLIKGFVVRTLKVNMALFPN